MFKGAITALITPMTQTDQIDWDAFSDLIDWQIDQGIDGLVPCGTTGEAPVLSDQEKKDLIKFCVERVQGRVPVIAGTGSNNTEQTVENTRLAKEAGADAALIIAPYYNKPDQAGAKAHFKHIADQVSLPVVIYNNPQRAVLDLSVETLSELSRHPNIIGLKDASSDLNRVCLYKSSCKESFALLSGDDATAYLFNLLGGVGCISVISNIVPKLCVELQTLCQNKAYDQALKLHEKLLPLHRAAYSSPSPGPVKYALSRLFDIHDGLRLPLLPASDTARQNMDEALKHVGVL